MLTTTTSAPNNAPLQEYVYLDGQPIAYYVYDANYSPSGPYFIHNDHQGTPQKVTDGNRAVVVNLQRSAFGMPLATTSSVPPPRLGFLGQFSSFTGWYWFNGFREYDAGVGRYLQADPIGLEGGMNAYLYANANPLSYTDPLGLNPGVGCLAGALAGPIGCGIGAGIGTGIMGGVALAAILNTPGDTTKPERCTDKPCPPCKTVSGKIVPPDTIGYRPMDTPSRPQHGITGSHFNIYKANQNPNNCHCFWQSVGAVPPSGLPAGEIPIEPFAN